jgi:hypothetical protein
MLKPIMCAFAVAAGMLATPATAALRFTFSNEFVQVLDLGAGTYSFSQSGFAQGATISGSFTGIDTDGDSQLSSFNNEISNFFVSFSGNSVVSGWSSTTATLVFDLNGSPLLGDGIGGTREEGISTETFTPYLSFWDVGPGPYDICTGNQPCAIVGSNVPEPSTWTMLIVGFGLAGVMMRRRRIAVA